MSLQFGWRRIGAFGDYLLPIKKVDKIPVLGRPSTQESRQRPSKNGTKRRERGGWR